MRGRPCSLTAALMVLVTCLVACVSYLGVITETALLTYVVPSALLAGLLGVKMRRTPLQGVVLVLVLAFLIANVVNLLSGEFDGPVARGALPAAAGTGLACVLCGSRFPALFLPPVALVVVGSLLLGGGGQVQLVAVVTAGLALVALQLVERDARAWSAPQRSWPAVTALLVMVLAAGVFAALFQGEFSGRVAEAPLRTTVNLDVVPPDALSLPSKVDDLNDAAAGLPVVTRDPVTGEEVLKPPPEPEEEDEGTSRWWWLLLALPLLLVLALVGRVLLSAWSWRRHYRRILASGDGPGSVWVWTVAHLTRLGMAPAPHQSPDVLAAGGVDELARPLRESVQALAAVVAPIVFAPTGAVEPLDETWELARRTSETAWEHAGVARRCRARWRIAPRPPRRTRVGRVRPHG